MDLYNNMDVELALTRIGEMKRKEIEKKYHDVFDKYVAAHLTQFPDSSRKGRVKEEFRIETQRKDTEDLMNLSVPEIKRQINVLESEIEKIIGSQTPEQPDSSYEPIHIGPHIHLPPSVIAQLKRPQAVLFDTYPNGRKITNRGFIHSRSGNFIEVECGNDDEILDQQAVTGKVKINLEYFVKPIDAKAGLEVRCQIEPGRLITWEEKGKTYVGEVARVYKKKVQCKNITCNGKQVKGTKSYTIQP